MIIEIPIGKLASCVEEFNSSLLSDNKEVDVRDNGVYVPTLNGNTKVKTLDIPNILHDIFLKTGNPRGCPFGGTVALLYRNLTDDTCSTSRYPDPHTTSILTQCTYVLNRLARHVDHQLPNFRIFTS
jgi:hypothetical protein